ncbi:glycosyltransferase family 4 protein (plasmid) [Rhizobium sullae]|uniref:Glycosyltransferase family 4 protein n=1 Tax=Rhizobium sullae TaxID=50338 RepID=A0ABY5XV34_RHISU|nr:glycosyltransferase family 4 protein [Rhizobium sullae]UWU18385.1 glycosyltransferase family 4 protein [Rhizobium sullae]
MNVSYATLPTGRPLKVLIVLPALGAGGTERVVNMLANHWAEVGYDVTLLTLENHDATPYYTFSPRVRIRRIGVPPRRAPFLVATWLAFLRVRRMRAEISRRKPDFLLSFLTRTNLLALVATLGTGIPTVVSERNNPDAQPFGPLWKLLQRTLYPRAFGLVTMTQGAMDHFSIAQRRRSWVIPNAVNLPVGWRDRRGSNVLTAVGRLTRQKGFDLLLQAFARIEARFPSWRLVIWGEGEARQELEAQREALGLASRVDLPGVTKTPGEWIETTDIFVLSSRYEGWGIVLLEAMAAGLPVVSFACKWGPEVMITNGHDGLLVPPEDIGALAQALEQTISDSELRRRLAANACRSADKYSRQSVLSAWDQMAWDVTHLERRE